MVERPTLDYESHIFGIRDCYGRQVIGFWRGDSITSEDEFFSPEITPCEED